MRSRTRSYLPWVVLTLGLTPVALAGLPGESAPFGDGAEAVDGERFFEASVRPVLQRSCHGCHGPLRQRAGLRLDSRAAVLRGSDRGAVVVPGDVDGSLLVRAIRHEGDLRMPPDNPLGAGAVETLVRWIEIGLPWPARPGEASPEEPSGRTIEEFVRQARREHWAFQPLRRPRLPVVRDASRVRNEIDLFVIARLERQGLSLAPPTSRRVLARRLWLRLTGLPPRPVDIEAFERDASQDSVERLIDRLLASPRYGEFWGRHWLDVARYADTKGYVFQEERRFPYAYAYRDYVIRSFNEDRRYDRFVTEQLAADQLELRGEDREALAAMGFLTLGRRFLNNRHDIIDDRIDVMTRGLMGLTVGCARCHDHKYDPIPSEDYYSLYGVFASSEEPDNLPLLAPAADSPDRRAYRAELEKLEKAEADFLGEMQASLEEHLRRHAADYLLAAARESRKEESDFLPSLAPAELRRRALTRWKEYLGSPGAGGQSLLAPWLALASLSDEGFAEKAPEVLERLSTASDPAGPSGLVVGALRESPPVSLRDVAVVYAGVLGRAEDAPGPEPGAGAGSFENGGPSGRGALAEVRAWLRDPATPTTVRLDEVTSLLNRAERNRHRELRKRVDSLQSTHPGAPARAMVLTDASRPFDPYVFKRGKPENRGKAVPRQFLAVLEGATRQPFRRGSGRLELARKIASPDNPLTARVLVNRVWLHHFGEGLVTTPGDFGLRGEPPSHPGLLDYLAWRFVEGGWSIKSLQRLILSSATFRQASSNPAVDPDRDPENRLLWKMPRLRLGFESTRDSMLAVAGRLDLTMGGRPVDLLSRPFSTRRTVYGFVDRQNLPGVFRTFDFANPDATCPERHETTVPPQALFMMNSPFVMEQARFLAGRREILAIDDPAGRIRGLYRLALARAPDPHELRLALEYTAGVAGGQPSSWERFAQVLLMSNEFVHVD